MQPSNEEPEESLVDGATDDEISNNEAEHVEPAEKQDMGHEELIDQEEKDNCQRDWQTISLLELQFTRK